MKKAADAFRSIGEVSQLVGVAPHVLRYWESQFPLFSPVKRRDGRRYYRPDDIKLAAGLCEILRKEGVSIRGAKKMMSGDRGAALKARGAARLGGDFAQAPPSAGQDNGPGAGARTNAGTLNEMTGDASEPKTAGGARKRRAAPAASLPLFPELDTVRAESPMPAATQAPASGDWLGRLYAICIDLRDGDGPAQDEAQAIFAQLSKARRALAA